VKNIHVSDNHGEKEEHLPPGEGIIDFRSAFQALRANGYTGPCNLEFHFPGCQIPSEEDLRQVRMQMEKLLWNR
jgi:sugar phosphate isomerase/epimerase